MPDRVGGMTIKTLVSHTRFQLQRTKSMTIPVHRFAFILLMCLSIPLTSTAQTVTIPDSNLRAVIEVALGKASGDTITTSDMAALPSLEAIESNISNLTGLEHAINLTWLHLRDNSISDLSSLAGLTNLTWLNLRYNSISDISAVSGLTNLTELYLYGNSISDLSALVANTGLGSGDTVDVRVNPLSSVSIDMYIPALQSRGVIVEFDDIVVGVVVNIPDSNLRAVIEVALGKASGDTITTSDMAALTQLEAIESNISNLTGLEHAINLIWLNLGYNSISDISAVSGLTNLTLLYLRDNSILDISPLVANTGLGSGDVVLVQANPLSYLSIHTHIPTLQSRGVTVKFDNQAHPALLKISGNNQRRTPGGTLANPFVVEVQDENGLALAGVTVTFAVVAGGGTLSTTSTTTDVDGRAQSTLTLGPNLGKNTVEVSADGIEGLVTFHAISDTESPPITADVNGDGNVNILDLVLVAYDLGNTGTNLAADVSGDGVVNILDLVLVAGMFGDGAAAPSAHPQVPETLTAVEVQQWLTDAILIEVKNVIMKRGILVLGQLLVSLTPRETELLANYPNPFNPETWIPYRLAEDAFVTLTIYDQIGHVVRTLEVGHRIAAAYESRSKAIYWDGRNKLGERMASGVYFYTLTAGDYSATRKMLILK